MTETRGEYYKRRRKERRQFGTTRTKCKDCGCYIPKRHKVWCKSEEAEKIRKHNKLIQEKKQDDS